MEKNITTRDLDVSQVTISAHQSKEDLPAELKREMGKLSEKVPGIMNTLEYTKLLPPAGFETIPWPGSPLHINDIEIDLKKFGKKLSQDLMNSYSGHCIGIYQQGFLRYSWTRGYARDKSLQWGVETNMHIASLSKFLTGLGMARCLELYAVRPDSLLIDHLPDHWSFHDHTRSLTFHDLLRHMTRFQDNGNAVGHDPSSYLGLKKIVSMPPLDQQNGSDYRYNNANFGLCRILIPIISGFIGRDEALSDEDWSTRTSSIFLDFMNTHVFYPSGVSNATAVSRGLTALGYPHPYAIAFEGSDYGDLSSVVGGFGWYISVKDYLKVLSAFNKGRIVSRSMKRHMLDNTYGLYPKNFKRVFDGTEYTLELHEHSGSWSGGSTGIRTYFYLDPKNDVQIVMYVNSAHPENSKDDGATYKDIWSLADSAFSAALFTTNLFDGNPKNYPINIISKSTGKAVTIKNNALAHGVKLELQDADGRSSQRFFTEKTDLAQTGLSQVTHALFSSHSGLAIEPYKSSMDSNEPMVQYPWIGRRTQHYYFELQPDGSQKILSECKYGNDPTFYLTFDVANDSRENGAPIVHYIPHGGDNQKFWIGAPLLNGSGLVLDISGGLADENNELIGFRLHGEGNQMFYIERVEHQYVRIVALNGKVLDVTQSSRENAVPVILYPWHGGANQQFKIVRINADFVKLKARHSGKFLEIDINNDGRRLIQASASERSNQKWKIHELQLQL